MHTLISHNKYLHMGLKHTGLKHAIHALKSTLPSKAQLHFLLCLSPFINLPICLLVLFRLQVIATKYMKTVTKDSLGLT